MRGGSNSAWLVAERCRVPFFLEENIGYKRNKILLYETIRDENNDGDQSDGAEDEKQCLESQVKNHVGGRG